ncbi:MAG: hypothetical protein QG620_672 [Patescibacteria group bacterium]|nr:hypothetical protein [Patescibacteria group bacterium]
MENENENVSVGSDPSSESRKMKFVLVAAVSIISTAAVALIAVNIFSSWRCVEGEWIRDGFPLSGKPRGGCVIQSSNPVAEKGESQEFFQTAPSSDKAPLEEAYFSEEMGIEIISPRKGEAVGSPLTVKGRAKQGWFFEGSFPVKILASDRTVLAETYASAQEDWTEKEWVEFSGTIEFPVPDDSEGFLLLEPDDPSGFPRYGVAVHIPVTFDFDSSKFTLESDYAFDKCGGYPSNEKILGDCGEDCNTENWKVYRNKKYGYSFRYPQDFKLTNNCKNTSCVSEEQGGDSVMLSGDLSESSWPLIEIRHFDTPAYNPPAQTGTGEWIKEKFFWDKDCLPMFDNIYFSGKDGKLFSGNDIYFPASPQAYSRREVYYIWDKKIFQIVMLDVSTPQARQFYNIWLSRFQVIGEK